MEEIAQSKKSIWRKWKWVLIGIGILLLAFLSIAFPPSFYLPHQRPVLILPFDPKFDSQSGGLLPMGEKTIHQDAPSGHPGIDFGFVDVVNPVSYLASMDGTVSSVRIYANPDIGKGAKGKTPLSLKEVDVTITNWPYQTLYGEMDADSLPATIKKGAKIKQGDFIGYGNFSTSPTMPGAKVEMIHWEFGSVSPIIDRFCPLDYFNQNSRTRIEKIWAETHSEIKNKNPKICNGRYDGKTER
jgi:hypothetical protein